MAGESFVLEVVADDDVDNNAFNSDALLTDFIVGRTSVSSQTSMINFKTSYSTSWKTVLIARKAGEFTIPAFTVNGQKTAPIQLKVLEATNNDQLKQQDLFINAKVSNKEVYVQQQFTLQVKLYIASELKRGSLTEPSLKGATITQVGKDKENTEIVNGRRYRVIERNYAINPQQSGDFTLSTPMFSGEVVKATSRRSSFLSFGETTPVSILGKEIPLKIRPIPESYQGEWLPSELLTLNDEWQPKDKKFKVGEPITRTITLTAAGLSEEQLPKLALKMPSGLKVYPDQPKLHTGVNNRKLVSQKVKNFAIVASKAGTYTLPKITIPWWNTVTNKYQEATLPEQTITVAANDDLLQPVINNSAVNTGNANADNCPTVPANQLESTKSAAENKNLQWLFLALWILTLFAWFISTRLKQTNKHQLTAKGVQPQQAPKQESNKKQFKSPTIALVSYCKNNDGKQAITAIIPWFNSITTTDNQATTIDEVINYIHNDDFTNAINHLQQCYYGDKKEGWQGDNLLTVIEKINANYKESAKKPQNSIRNKLNLNP